jgi:hypothetical protein
MINIPSINYQNLNPSYQYYYKDIYHLYNILLDTNNTKMIKILSQV